MMSAAEQRHNEHCKRIAMHPEIIGLHNIILSCQDNYVFQNGVLVKTPDIIMFNQEQKKLFIIEYKGDQREESAKKQLSEYWYYLKPFKDNYDIKKLFACRDYQVKPL